MRNSIKVEALIESSRSEGKWQRVIELTEELKTGSPNNECLVHFLLGEARLEHFLEDNAPTESNFAKAKTSLTDARRCLQFVTGDNGQKAGIALDAYLLLAKLCYACGEYDKCLENFLKAELNTLAEKELTLRSLKILAESYAIKGLCLESCMHRPSSKFKKSEKENEMINCFERATDLGLLYLQEQDIASYSSANSNSNTSGSTLAINSTTLQQSSSNLAISSTMMMANTEQNRRMGAILETALQRAPIVLIKSGKLHEAIELYRRMLNAIETKTTQSLRLTLSRQLAEVLLRGVSGTIYTAPFIKKQTTSGTGTVNSKRLWKPRKYAARNQFTPRNQHEETILLLLIAETLAVRDTVLSQSPEFRIARQHAMGNASAVYDLLTLASIRWGLVNLITESFEKALKFSFGEQHIWRQYGICLTASGKHMHALKVLQESIKLTPSDALPCLMAARLCYENLGLIEEGLQYAQQASKRETKGLKYTRSQLYMGIGYQQLAIHTTLKAERDNYNKLALDALEKAAQIDGNDHLNEYYLSLQHALLNNMVDAMLHIRLALALRAEHAPSLHLFSLLLTASRRPREALTVVENALDEFPDNLNLLHVKAHLQLHLQDAEIALATVQRMLAIWRDVFEGQLNNNNGTAADDERHSDTKSVIVHMHSSQMSDKDSSSVYAASLAAVSRVEQALSEAASSLSSFTPKPGPQRPWMIQIKIWLLLADVYLSIEQPNEAQNCLQEASQIYPLSHQVMFTRGQICVYMEHWNDAKQCFLNAVAANPNHAEALRALGETHHILGEPRLAEKMLKDAAKLDPHCPKIWFSLGKVMETLGDYTSSADCLATALQLEPSCPILPFNTIALTFE